MYAWLKENKIFITQHTMKTNHTTLIGYLLGMHPTLSSRDAMKLLLDGYIRNNIEYNLIMMSKFYITEKGKKVNTHVVEVHVDSKEAKCAKELLSECWHQETFVKALEEHSVGMLIDFIPNIQKGVTEVSTFRETLRRQTEFAGNTIAILIEGIGGLEVEINHNGSLASLADIVKKLKSDEGKPLISGIEPTKFTSDSGRYLFLTQKNVVNKAEQKLDNLFETLAKNGQLDTFSIKGMFIHCIKQIQSKQVATHADSFHSKYALPVATVPAPATPSTPIRNPWNRTATFKLSHENFPEMNDTPTHHHKDKKARTETGTDDNADDTSLSPPSLGTTQTELTDKCTEFQATMATMQDTLSKKIQSIKDANDAKARQAETRIQQAEKTYIAAQETIVKEYENISQNYNNVLEAFTNLSCDVCTAQVKQDKQNLGMKQTISSMMHILVGIHQTLLMAQVLYCFRRNK
jgi:hypothetical protein